jgi:flagellar protein FlaG
MDSVQKIVEVGIANRVQPVKNKEEKTKKVTIIDTGLDTKEVENLDKVIEKSKEFYEKNKEETSNIQNLNKEKLRKILDQLKESMPNTEPKFGVHEETNRMMIKIVDKDTQKVVREFPLEKALDQLAKNLELAGALIDKKL